MTAPNAPRGGIKHTYDAAGQLTSISYARGSTALGDLAYGYDAARRRTALWGSYARTGLPAATTAPATYDAANRLTSWNGTALSYDANGNLVSFGSQTFTWNDRGQLAGTSAGGASFTYDGLGRRLARTVGGVTTRYLYDGANVVQEQNASNAATANLLTGLAVDQVFSRQVVGGGTSSLLTDALGSTIALAGPSGAISTSYTYEPFGAVTSFGATDTNPYRFTGREDDGATGLCFYRARYYSPTFSRFISEDPLGFPGGPDPNLYAYVGNRPTMLTDLFGLEPAGCGFLGFGCVGDVLLRVVAGVGRYFLPSLWAAKSVIYVGIAPLLATAGLVTLAVGSVVVCVATGPAGCAAALPVGILAGCLIVRALPEVYEQTYSRETWGRIQHEFEVLSGRE